jgi:oleate hydratase
MSGWVAGSGRQRGKRLQPAGSVFDNEFRCTFDLLDTVPSASNPAISVKKEFFTFNTRHPFDDRARLIDRNGHIVHGPRFGLSLRDGFDLARLALSPEAMLDGRRIEEFFSAQFFSTEFWLCYSTIMGSLPQHSAMELRRYLNRTLHMFPYISDMANIGARRSTSTRRSSNRWSLGCVRAA